MAFFSNNYKYFLFSLFELLKVLHPLQNHSLVRFLHFPGQNELIENAIDFVEVEDNIKLYCLQNENNWQSLKFVDWAKTGRLI